jgi:hypothetical protein
VTAARTTKPPRFKGLTLSEQDHEHLRARERQPMGMLLARRIQILRLLDRERTIAEVAEIVGTYRREVRRVARRFVDGGVTQALTDEPRRRRAKLLDDAQAKAVIALVCGPPPEGRTRWTIALLTAEVRRRKIVGTISRETIRRTLASQDTKPWLEKNVVHSRDRRTVRREDEGRAGAVRETARPARARRRAR